MGSATQRKIKIENSPGKAFLPFAFFALSYLLFFILIFLDFALVCPLTALIVSSIHCLRQGLPSVPVQRSLTLIAKVIQSLANLNAASIF